MVRQATAARFNADTHTHIYIYIYIYIFTLVINGEVLDLRAQSRYLTAYHHIILTLNSAFSGHNF